MNCTYCTDTETGRTIYGHRRQQPAGLASYQARKAAQEAARLAPYSVVNEKYGNYPWHVLKDGQELGYKGWFETKKAAIAWIEEQKEQEQRTTDDHSEQKKEEKPVKNFEVGFENDGIFSVNIIWANTGHEEEEAVKETAERRAARYGYKVAYIKELAAWEVEEKTRKGMPYYPIDSEVEHKHDPSFSDETPDDHSETTDETPAQDAEQTETTDDHSAQEQPAEQKEEKKMKKVEFAQDAIIVNGQEYAARYEYGETPRGHYLPTIRIYTALSGSACVVELPDDDSEYDNARAAMEKAQEQPDETPAQDAEQPAEQPDETPDDHSETTDETPAPTAQEEPQEQPETPAQDAEQPDETPAPTAQEEPQEQQEQTETTDDHSAQAQEEPQEEQPAPDPKQARGPVPEKTFIGTSISGHGYSIVFDGGCNRTRVIVTDDVKEKARPIIEKAGFYYSAALDSWNKKLTFRAYRAAQALAAELEKALAA